MPRPQSKVYVPFVRRIAMAQSSSWSQREMKLDWRSIDTRLMRAHRPRRSSSSSSTVRWAKGWKRLTWSLQPRNRHSDSKTRQSTIRTEAKAVQNDSQALSSPEWNKEDFKSVQALPQAQNSAFFRTKKKKRRNILLRGTEKRQINKSPPVFPCVCVKVETVKHHFCIPTRRKVLDKHQSELHKKKGCRQTQEMSVSRRNSCGRPKPRLRSADWSEWLRQEWRRHQGRIRWFISK